MGQKPKPSRLCLRPSIEGVGINLKPPWWVRLGLAQYSPLSWSIDVRLSPRRIHSCRRSYFLKKLEAIGTGTWRSVEAVREFFEMHWPNRYDAAFVNGSLHWLVRSDLGNPTCIFNFETLQFGSFLLPPPDSDGHDHQLENIGGI
ncbi:hypothetical protein D5086_007532 [Populus alba]|uniref:Uncharacterized protein n=4 Tax=Populus TaxID=3689 RepID=A0ACC4CNV2_POPAL|nr:hypothetical protein NC653_009732 [Populus alba x Populus x berolinensis]TKS08866.1 hypothetical protein D5086_0000101650 [Populus alba]